ncbi:MAG TPA: hypothetical protein VIR30_07125, partial [Nocardioides sp.]
AEPVRTTELGAVLGAHVGPGMAAICIAPALPGAVPLDDAAEPDSDDLGSKGPDADDAGSDSAGSNGTESDSAS